MGNFNWNRDQFGDQAEAVEKIINDAMALSKKETAIEKEKIIKDLETKRQELETKLAGFETTNKLDEALKDVDDQNKDLIKDLVGNDLSKLDEVKEKYKNLFSKKPSNIDDIIKNGVPDGVVDETEQSLREKVISGKGTDEDEIELAKMLAKKFNA